MVDKNFYIRVGVLVALFGTFGVVNNVNAFSTAGRPPESWLENMAPATFGDYELVPEVPGSKVSYKMDKLTYDELNPIGICAQKWKKGIESYDVVIIAGDQMESFHDQRWCFVAQGWTLDQEKVIKFPTKSHGDIPGYLVQIERPGIPKTWALFTFQGPNGFRATTPEASKDYFMHEITTGKRFTGFSYRFIPQWTGATAEQVLKFAGDFIDRANETSKGIL
ncbi:MAG: hypothetical protein KIT11_03660 [Fimbriimonadaceae bacterium]|nr:hypothetical protein [Fimbriimonadaceae bacterium]QYK57006.1 MAG: hypothetical protein KF733_05865 [Fimbriimonadaceae bacterium]